MYNSVVFIIVTRLCKHHHYLIPQHFHHPQENPIGQSLSILVHQPLIYCNLFKDRVFPHIAMLSIWVRVKPKDIIQHSLQGPGWHGPCYHSSMVFNFTLHYTTLAILATLWFLEHTRAVLTSVLLTDCSLFWSRKYFHSLFCHLLYIFAQYHFLNETHPDSLLCFFHSTYHILAFLSMPSFIFIYRKTPCWTVGSRISASSVY